MTLLALGNTLADLFANGSLSSLGFAVMACTGTISGQFFNLIFGLGLNLFFGTAEGPIEFKLFKFGGKDNDGQFNLLIIGTVMSVLTVVLSWSFIKGFKLTQRFSKVLFGMYFLVLVIAFVGFFMMNRD